MGFWDRQMAMFENIAMIGTIKFFMVVVNLVTTNTKLVCNIKTLDPLVMNFYL